MQGSGYPILVPGDTLERQRVLESRTKALWALNAPCGTEWKRRIERKAMEQAALEGEVKPGCNYSCLLLPKSMHSAQDRAPALH